MYVGGKRESFVPVNTFCQSGIQKSLSPSTSGGLSL